MTGSIPPPRAPKRPKQLELHGDVRIDDWHWLQEKDDPAVTKHLESENSYTKHVLSHTEEGQERLFQEFKSRIQETDLSVPTRKNDWWYYSRTEEGQQYAIHCRQPDAGGKPAGDEKEHVFFDTNAEAGEEFFSMGTFDVSPDATKLAYSVDRDGDEVFDLKFRDLGTGADFVDVIERAHYGGAWSRDGSVYFYTRPNESQRPYQVWRHVLGTPVDSDEMLFQEDDERFFVGVGNTKTEDYIVIGTSSSLTSEIHLLDADNPLGSFAVVEARREEIEYHIEHHRGEGANTFYVMTNEDAPNFKLMRCDASNPSRANWTEVIGHRVDVKLDGVEAFADYLVLSERENANEQITVIEIDGWKTTVIEQEEEVYSAGASGNATFDTSALRFVYTSMVSPRSVFEYDMRTGERTLLKKQPVLGEYDSAEYETRREWATASDGTKIPLSIVYRKDRKAGGPALLYGYGSYEISTDPTFSSLRLSMLDRGFMFVIAHVRGGGDMGRLWYEHGKFFETGNRFTDFITCAEHIVEAGYTKPENLVIRGGSAGGLLVGAVANMRPDLFKSVVADVPFVDVLTTMLDTTQLLTVHEYEEWGNPQEKDVYDYIKSYSPVDNVTKQDYPIMLVMAGLNDPRVGYWEAAKWVQKLRDANTADTQILLKTEMGAGHMGPSGRYNAWKDEAFIYAFIFDSVGVEF